jgi:rhamnogalacturonan endolyase
MKSASSRGRPADGRRLFLEPLEDRVVPAFGITTSSSSYTVDTGANVVFKVARSNAGITSVTYRGTELTAPHSLTNRYSHYESGLSSTSTSITTSVNLTAGTAVVAATDSSLGVTQYYVARNGYDIIYMATYAGGPSPPTPGEMRFIFYLNRSIFTVDPYSDINGRTVIEDSDVYKDTATGYTYSKFYSSRRNLDDPYHGVTGSGVGAFMMIGSREKGSGGPFFKDIAEQGTNAAEELYNYMYSGHAQTEAFRPGLQGPYALEITDGSQPAAVDYSFMDNLGLTGWVAASGRGTVAGRAVGVPAGYAVTVGLSNASAQYWTTPDSSGNYSLGGVLPGTYTETLYANELAVGSGTVTVSAGGTTNADVQDTAPVFTTLWTIGTWDGTPNEFLNEPALHTEHPSDTRMAPWSNVNYVVGTNSPSDWPAVQWKDVNNGNRITFTLTAGQASVANTLRIFITDAFAGGRPQITVNAGQAYHWTSALPAPSSQPSTRSITLGTYRGNNTTFTYNIPRSALVAGTNTIDISVNSGTAGSGFLSPAVVYDAIYFGPTFPVTTPLNGGDFETPNVGTGSPAYQYNPSGSAWTFDSGSGVAGNASDFTSGNPDVPEGTQVAFLQGYGTISQSLTFAAGTYSLSFLAAQRGNYQYSSQTFQVLIDGNVVGTFTPAGTSYAAYTTGGFTLAAGVHTVSFVGLDPDGQDNTAFLDQVALNQIA